MSVIQKQQVSISEETSIFIDQIKLSLLKHGCRSHRSNIIDAIIYGISKSGMKFTSCKSIDDVIQHIGGTLEQPICPDNSIINAKVKRNIGNELEMTTNYLNEGFDKVNKNFTKMAERLNLLKMEVEKI